MPNFENLNELVGVPAIYRENENRIDTWKKAGLEGKLDTIDFVIHDCFRNYRLGELDEAYAIKKTLLKCYFGQTMSDEEYEAFDKALAEDPKKRELFDELVQDMDIGTIKRNKEDLSMVLFGKELATMRHEKDESVKIPTDEEVSKAAANTEKMLEHKFLKVIRIHTTEDYLRNEADKLRKQVKEARDTLGLAIPNRAANGPQMKMPFQDKEALLEAQFLAAARIVGARQFAPQDPANGALLDLSVLLDASKIREAEIQNLAKDQDFRGFVLSEIDKKDAERFDPESMFNHWNSYKKNLDAARDDYRKQVAEVLEKKGEIPEQLKFFAPDVGGAVVGAKDDFAVVEKNDGALSTKENLKAQAKAMLDNAKSETGDKALEQKDFVKAANLIVADGLLTKAADMTFFETKEFQNEQGEYVIGKMNKSIVDMRNQVIQDPVFQRVLATRVKSSEIVSAYHSELKKEVNKKIDKQAKAESEYKKNETRSREHQKYATEHTVELTDKERTFIEETLSHIETYNKGKDPSEQMKRLTRALKDVTGVNGKQIPIDKMEELNKATLSYYKDRQGILFSPFTKKGKARLGAVEKMAFLTDSVMDRAAKQERKDMAAVHPRLH